MYTIDDIETILFSEEQIIEICKKLAKQINEDYKDKSIVMVGMLKGAMPFMMELIKYLNIPVELDFMQISSYHGGTSSTNVVFKKDIETNVYDKHVIIVDDIIDTGLTMKEVLTLFETRHCASVEACCLLDKPHHRKTDFDPKYVGAIIPDGFVVGFGLDYEEYMRNIPCIGFLKKSVYEK